MKYGLVAVLVAAACGAQSSESVSQRDCEALRDHIAQLRLQRVTDDLDQHRAAFSAAIGESFVPRCVAEVSREQMRCSLDSRDAQALAACGRR